MGHAVACQVCRLTYWGQGWSVENDICSGTYCAVLYALDRTVRTVNINLNVTIDLQNYGTLLMS